MLRCSEHAEIDSDLAAATIWSMRKIDRNCGSWRDGARHNRWGITNEALTFVSRFWFLAINPSLVFTLASGLKNVFLKISNYCYVYRDGERLLHLRKLTLDVLEYFMVNEGEPKDLEQYKNTSDFRNELLSLLAKLLSDYRVSVDRSASNT